MQKYIRLLSYENACKVIDFVNKSDVFSGTKEKEDYANITVGGVSVQISEENYPKMEDFIKSLKVRYEIGDVAPYKVEQQIVRTLKERGVI